MTQQLMHTLSANQNPIHALRRLFLKHAHITKKIGARRTNKEPDGGGRRVDKKIVKRDRPRSPSVPLFASLGLARCQVEVQDTCSERKQSFAI